MRDLLVVPKICRMDVLYSCHDSKMAGHLDFNKTWQRIRNRFWWPGILNAVEKYTKSCVSCQTRNVPTQRPKGALQVIPISTFPFQRVHLDLAGPVPWSHDRYRYIAVCVDSYTKFLVVGALRTKEAKEVANWFIKSVILQHFVPHTVVTDGGLEFLNQVLDGVFEVIGVKHIHTTPYHPASNGQVERNHSTASRIISKYISEDHKDWTSVLPFATFAYNSSVHSTTQYSPFHMLYHREPLLPVDIMMPTSTNNDFVQDFRQKIEDMQVLTKARIEDQNDYSINYYQDLRKECSFSVDDLVLLYNPTIIEGHARKFTHPYRGIYRVISQTSPVNYLLEKTTGKMRRETAHVSRMKKYFDRAELMQESKDESSDETESESDTEISHPSDSEEETFETYRRMRSVAKERVRKRQNAEIVNPEPNRTSQQITTPSATQPTTPSAIVSNNVVSDTNLQEPSTSGHHHVADPGTGSVPVPPVE